MVPFPAAAAPPKAATTDHALAGAVAFPPAAAPAPLLLPEFPMRLLFATIAAALAALAGEVIEFEGLYPTR